MSSQLIINHSAVTAAHPRLTKSPKEEKKSLYVFFYIRASISIGREIRYLPYAGAYYMCLLYKHKNFIRNISFMQRNFRYLYVFRKHLQEICDM